MMYREISKAPVAAADFPQFMGTWWTFRQLPQSPCAVFER